MNNNSNDFCFVCPLVNTLKVRMYMHGYTVKMYSLQWSGAPLKRIYDHCMGQLSAT